MAITIPRADLYALREIIQKWVSHLAENDYDGAASLLARVPGIGVDYDGSTIRYAIGRYNPDYRDASESDRDSFVPAVTSIDRMVDSTGENMTIYCPGGADLPTIDYDLPLEGIWSDLTAKFRILKVDGGYSLGLQDIRVL
jgi:hypothetical protein